MQLLGQSALPSLCLMLLFLSGCNLIGSGVQPRVPGLDELVVYDPGTHERGLPAVMFNETEEGNLEVEIPPAVHVHRYYYSGNKEFQGPLIPGGPTTIVANHPKTGERLYVDAVLPAGAPVIAHDESSITYIYPENRVKVSFGKLFHDRITVKHLAGKGAARHVRDKKEAVKKHIHQETEQFKGSELYRVGKEAFGGSGDIISGLGQSANTLASQSLTMALTAANFVPGVSALQSMGEDAAVARRDAELKRATDLKEQATSKYLPTLR